MMKRIYCLYRVSTKKRIDRNDKDENDISMQKKLGMELSKNKEQLTNLRLEIGKTLTGESSYVADDLFQAIKMVKARITDSGHGRRNLTWQRWQSTRLLTAGCRFEPYSGS